MKQLTRTQKLFISEYIKSLDPIKAVTFAGFPDDADKAKIASEFLSKDIIIRGIKARLKCRIDSLNVPKGYVIQKLLQIAEFSLEEEEITDKDGNYTGKKKLRDASAGLKALEALCKYLGFQTKDEDKNRKEAKIITISNLDDKKI
ncbi:MAG: terminase small subunit [Cyanobacteriota bacterium]|nr:terminase small subunit [Cyanobacteriota bacterium]MDY6383135.1 terminase small subunit [Cyanobacteriota bacterium]